MRIIWVYDTKKKYIFGKYAYFYIKKYLKYFSEIIYFIKAREKKAVKG